MFDKVKAIFEEQLGVSQDEMKLDTNFKDDLGVDSLDLYEIVMKLEDEFDVEIPALGDAELVQQTGREGELLVGAVAQIVHAVREIHGHVTEADERNGVVGAVCTVAARPVREVDHQVGVHEHIGRALRIAA